jgi:heme-degrading monooxygenase HmoA
LPGSVGGVPSRRHVVPPLVRTQDTIPVIFEFLLSKSTSESASDNAYQGRNDSMNAQEASSDGEPVTLINVFEVPAEHAETFLAQWRERAQQMNTQPGFRNAAMYQALSSETRFQFVNVAQWDSREAHEKAVASPEFQSRVRAVRDDPEQKIAAHPALYRVVAQYEQS